MKSRAAIFIATAVVALHYIIALAVGVVIAMGVAWLARVLV